MPRFTMELKPLESFYPAEKYHQRYLEKHPSGYCRISSARVNALARFPFRAEDHTRPAEDLLMPHLKE